MCVRGHLCICAYVYKFIYVYFFTCAQSPNTANSLHQFVSDSLEVRKDKKLSLRISKVNVRSFYKTH